MERRLAVHARSDAQALIARRIATVLAVAASLLCATADARPKRRDARVAFDRGVAFYQKGNYQAAADALGKSFEAEHDPETLFAWAQAERKLEHCDKAINLYDQLLTFNLPPANRTVVEQKLAECKTIIAAQQPPPPAEPPPAAPPPPVAQPTPVAPGPVTAPPASPPVTAPPDEPAATASRPFYRDPVTLGLLGGAVVTGAAAGGFFLAARSASDGSKTANNYDSAKDLKHSAELRGSIGIGCSIASGALLVGGVTWILLKHRGGSREQPTVTGLVLPRGGGLAFTTPW